MTTSSSQAELARPVDLSRLGDGEAVHRVVASAPERAALARRFDLPAIDALSAEVRLRRVRGGAAIRLSGRLSARVVQSCVVTLEPVPADIAETFSILFADRQERPETVMIGDEADEDWPEPLPEGPLDIGEVVAQQLSLALDPYPRAPGAAAEAAWQNAGGGRESPFAPLAVLKGGKGSAGKA